MSTEYQRRTSRPFSPTWTCDPVFGIVHSSGCNTCLHYVRHVAATSQSENDPSFRDAVKERDSQRTFCYLNGFCEGGRPEEEEYGHTADMVRRYRDERDEAVELANHRTAELLATKEALLHMHERFQSLQALFDEMVEFSTGGKPFVGDRMTHLEDILLGTSSDQDQETYALEPSSQPVDVLPLPTPPASPSRVRSYLPSPPLTPEALPDVSPLPSALPPPDSIFLDGPPTSANDEAYAASVSASPKGTMECVDREPTPESCGTTPALETQRSVFELNWLMDDAREGDTQALLRVNELYMGAHLAPSKDRTSVQQSLILEWKDVRPSLTSGKPSSRRPPLGESDTPEIFVDASGWGVGFMLNGRWLAWKLKPGWKCQGRDNNWAEMVAVELGLHVAIAAGFHSQTIVMRSDNWGVVQSLLKGKSRHAKQLEILREIVALTKRCKITLIPVWVPTAENPADKPSRGVFASKALLFPISLPLPNHLVPFLQPSVEFRALPR